MKFTLLALLPSLSLLTACSSMPAKPISTASQVELTRFMGPWYVIASIPTFAEKDAFGAIESYALNADGSVATTFTFHKGAFDGPLKTMKPTGFVRDGSNATWGMQFVWPFKAEYLIAYVDPEYSETIIARNKRDYVWIMARTPELAPERYRHLVDMVGQLGYDLSKLKRVPQRTGNGATPSS
jgi:apolipoprotein D and lipocalin family protein